MSMRKDREITIIRESSKSSVRSRENLNPSLVEALFDENYDVSSLGSLNEERLKAPGYSKKDEKFVDQYSTVRDLAKGVDNKNAKEFEVNIPGVPKKITIVKNRFGVSRVYTGASQASEEEAWKFRSDTKEERFPVIEITPATPAQPQAQEENPYADAEDAAEADRMQSQMGRDEQGEEEEDTDSDGPPPLTDDDYLERDDQERPPHDLEITDDDEDNVPKDDDRPPGAGENADSTEYGDKDPNEMPQDPQAGGEQGGGSGEGGQPPPPPTGDAKAVSDYIDQVATGAQTVDLSEIRRPLHKRSLIELLYSS